MSGDDQRSRLMMQERDFDTARHCLHFARIRSPIGGDDLWLGQLLRFGQPDTDDRRLLAIVGAASEEPGAGGDRHDEVPRAIQEQVAIIGARNANLVFDIHGLYSWPPADFLSFPQVDGQRSSLHF